MRTFISTVMLLCMSSAVCAYTNPRSAAMQSFSMDLRSERAFNNGYTCQLRSVAPARTSFALRSIHTMPSGTICFPMSTGTPFCTSAVFCRMENHFLNKYNVKFSIHTGGFRG